MIIFKIQILQIWEYIKICIKLLYLMGTTQSLSYQSNIQLPKQWKQITKTNDSIIYSHITTKDLCRSIKLTKIPFKDYRIYDSRLKSSQRFTPTIYSYSGQPIQIDNQTPQQQALYNVHIIVQEAKYKLSQYPLSQLFQKQNIICKLQEVILGYQFLYQNYGAFKVDENQLGWTYGFQTKVWINSNFAFNTIETGQSTPTEMLQSIFNIFSQFIPRKYQNAVFKNFSQALETIKKILPQNSNQNKNESLRATYGGLSNQSQINLITKTIFSPNQSIKINFLNGTKNQSSKLNELTGCKINKSIQSSNQNLNQRTGPLYSTMPKKPFLINTNQLNIQKSNQPYFSKIQRFSIDPHKFRLVQLSSAKQIHNKSSKKKIYNRSKNKNIINNQMPIQRSKEQINDQDRLTLSYRHKHVQNQKTKDLTMSIRPIIKNNKGKKQISYPNPQAANQIQQSLFSPNKPINFNKNVDQQFYKVGNKINDIANIKTPRKTLSKLDHKLHQNVNTFQNPSSEIQQMFREKNRMNTQQNICNSLPFEILSPKSQVKLPLQQKQNLSSKKIQILIEAVAVTDVLQDELNALFVEERQNQQYEKEQINIELINEFISFFDD